ncbi:MAG: VIT1/CCC1 transporter family protein [Planctomycetaceae bacterium]|nr:VIT1/CCC1 transporter family protein [Planctomycetaceae bacterium]
MPNPSDQNLAQLRDEHTPDAVRARLEDGPQHSYLKDFVYGAIDGAVTTFAIVSGVAGAELSAGVVIVLGVANLIGDGFSMAASNFLGTRAENQLREKARRIEEEHIELYPEGEKEEIRQIVSQKGFEGEDLDRAVEIITSDRSQWVDMMMREELGLSLENPPAWRAALTTFLAFVTVGSIPLLVFFANLILEHAIPSPYLLSALMTGVAFFAVGAFKSRFVDEKWYVAGVETLFVGGLAAGLAYLVGILLKDFV